MTPTPSNDLLTDKFRHFAQHTAAAVGSPWSFAVAVAVILVWGVTGPIFHYSDTWQLVINTGTTVVTFLMVFLIQSTQNRDAHAIHLKLDELIRAGRNARNGLVGLEDLTDAELARLHTEFERIRTAPATTTTARRRAHDASAPHVASLTSDPGAAPGQRRDRSLQR